MSPTHSSMKSLYDGRVNIGSYYETLLCYYRRVTLKSYHATADELCNAQLPVAQVIS